MAEDKKKTEPVEDEPAQPTQTNPDPDVPPAAPHTLPSETEIPAIPAVPAVPATPATPATPAAPAAKPKSGKRLEKFLALTGFDRADVDIVHEEAGIFGTVQGGKYKLNKGGEIITLKGPVPAPPEEVEA